MEKKDFEEVIGNAQGLKGGCASIGLIKLREMAYSLEKAGKDKDLQTIEKVLPDLMQEAEEVKQLINNRELFK